MERAVDIIKIKVIHRILTMPRPTGVIHRHLFNRDKNPDNVPTITEDCLDKERRRLIEQFKAGDICQKQLCKELKKLKVREDDDT